MLILYFCRKKVLRNSFLNTLSPVSCFSCAAIHFIHVLPSLISLFIPPCDFISFVFAFILIAKKQKRHLEFFHSKCLTYILRDRQESYIPHNSLSDFSETKIRYPSSDEYKYKFHFHNSTIYSIGQCFFFSILYFLVILSRILQHLPARSLVRYKYRESYSTSHFYSSVVHPVYQY